VFIFIFKTHVNNPLWDKLCPIYLIAMMKTFKKLLSLIVMPINGHLKQVCLALCYSLLEVEVEQLTLLSKTRSRSRNLNCLSLTKFNSNITV